MVDAGDLTGTIFRTKYVSSPIAGINITTAPTDISLGSVMPIPGMAPPSYPAIGTFKAIWGILTFKARALEGNGTTTFVSVQSHITVNDVNVITVPVNSFCVVGTANLQYPGVEISGNVSADLDTYIPLASFDVVWKQARVAANDLTMRDVQVTLEMFWVWDLGIKSVRLDYIDSDAIGNTASSFTTYLTETEINHWKGAILLITSGDMTGQSRYITSYDPSTKIITVDRPFTSAPAPASYESFVILPSDQSFEDKLDTIQAITDVIPDAGALTTLQSDITSIKGAIIADAGSVVADGGTTVSYFKTNLSSTTLNFWANLQVMFITGNNAGIARRISAYSAAKFITVSEALPNIPVAADTFVIIGRVAGAGSALSDDSIADAVWNELKSGHTAATSFGKIVQDLETTLELVRGYTIAAYNKLPSATYLMGSAVATGKDDEIDAILVDTAEMQPKVSTIHGKMPSSAYLKGTADADGGMDTADKADVKAQADLALSDYDPPTDTEMDAMGVALTAEINANEAKIDIVTTMVAQIQNNVFFSTTVLDMYQRPTAGSTTYRVRAMVFDGTGTPEDPDSEELCITLDGTSGAIIARTLMTRQSLGIYYYDVVIASTDTLEDWTFTFDYLEATVLKTHYRQSALTEWTSDLNDIQAKTDAIYVKVGAIAPSPTIPAQILTHDTDIKALPNIQSTPEYLVIPSGVTRVNIDGGIDASQTDIDVYDALPLGGDGDVVCVLIGSEYITGTISFTDSQLQSCTRGAYGTVGATHANNAAIYQVMIHPLRLNIFDNAMNMKAPDTAPTVSIADWAGVVEIAPTAMTLISTGLYGYNYFCIAGTDAKSRTLRFSIVIGGITTLRQSTLMVLDLPASQADIQAIIGGGLGEYIVTQDGYMDGSGIFQYWTDVMKNYLRDATTGSRLDDVMVTAYRVVNGQVILALIPPGQTVCDANGNYQLRLDAGTYVFKFYKDQYRFPTDEVTRVVTP